MSTTNLLLFLIVVILLFGSAAVLGFVSTIFWIAVAFTVLIGIIIFMGALPKAAGNIVFVEETEGHEKSIKKFSVFNLIILIAIIVFFIWVVVNSSKSKPQTYQNTPSNVFVNNSADSGSGSVQGDAENPTATPEQTKTYYETARISFLENCYKTSGGMTNSCNCLLNYLESKYSISEFARIEDEYRQTNIFPQEMINTLADGVTYCKDK